MRPAAGGIVFGSGTAAQTAAVADPGEFASSGDWIPVAIGVVVALVVSLTKTAVRPVGQCRDRRRGRTGALDHRGRHQLRLVFVALLIPVLVLVILVALIWAGWRLWRRIAGAAARRRPRAAQGREPAD